MRLRFSSSRLWLIHLLVLLGLPALTGAPRQTSDQPIELRHLYVAPDGRPQASGTKDDPLSLEVALSDEGPTRPGNTVWLRGGTYRGVFVSRVSGLPEAPITVRQYPGERAVIDSSPSAESALGVVGSWTIFWGFEVTNSNPIRRTAEGGPWPDSLKRGTGVFAVGAHNTFVNLIVHDMANGFGVWTESEGSVVYGNLVYYNGWEGPDRAHGHGIYTQNRRGIREVADNIVFGQFSHGIHAYASSSGFLDDITLRGNVVFNNGMIANSRAERDILLGGGRRASRPILEDNATYGPAQTNLGYGAGCTPDGVVTGNYFVGAAPLILVACSPLVRNNTFVGPMGDLALLHPDNVYLATAPTSGVVVTLRVNRYEPTRAQVVVYNWERRAIVEVEPPAFLQPDDEYEIIDAQNYFGVPVAKGIHRAGQRLAIPMTGRALATPVGDVSVAPHHSSQEFGVFLLRGLPKDQPTIH